MIVDVADQLVCTCALELQQDVAGCARREPLNLIDQAVIFIEHAHLVIELADVGQPEPDDLASTIVVEASAPNSYSMAVDSTVCETSSGGNASVESSSVSSDPQAESIISTSDASSGADRVIELRVVPGRTSLARRCCEL